MSQLVLAPVNGTYGLKNPATGVVDTETLGRLFGQTWPAYRSPRWPGSRRKNSSG